MFEAQAQIDALNAANLERFPELATVLKNAGFHTFLVPWREELTGELAGTLHLLWGGVGFVLLIACVNIANLLLVRSQVRLKELAIRSPMGAARGRIARQLLTETLLLTLVGASLGVALGHGALSVLHGFGTDELPRGSEIRMDLVSVALIPVARMVRMNLADVVHQEGRTATGGRGARALRKGLVVVQVGFALVLLIGAGLLLASFRRVTAIDPGFHAPGVLTASVSLPPARYAEPLDRASFAKRVLPLVRSLPGVEMGGLTSDIPFGGSYRDSVILAEGYEMQPGESLISPARALVSPGYFEAIRISLLSGPFFDERDDEMYYFPYSQEPTRFFTFAVRTSSRPDSVVPGARAAIASLDPELPLSDVHCATPSSGAGSSTRTDGCASPFEPGLRTSQPEGVRTVRAGQCIINGHKERLHGRLDENRAGDAHEDGGNPTRRTRSE
jgi:hypothetical protein